MSKVRAFNHSEPASPQAPLASQPHPQPPDWELFGFTVAAVIGASMRAISADHR